MLYNGQTVEVLGTKKVFGEEIAWIRILETHEFKRVAFNELEQADSKYSIAYIRFLAVAGKIKDEIARKSVLTPYESGLLPLPHQILVLEKVLQSPQNRFLLAA